jgi:hypothetical protein
MGDVEFFTRAVAQYHDLRSAGVGFREFRAG